MIASRAGFDGDPDETGRTFRKNALIKARAVAKCVSHPVLADDSGLEVEALGGAPGIHSARYAGPKAGDADNRAKLLKALREQTNRRARFVCALCFLAAGENPRFFEGECRGSIALVERGGNGFGYDSLFIAEGESRTFGEMQLEEKNPLSHRGRATKLFLDYLRAAV